VLLTACASWALYDAQVHLRDGVLLDEQARCLAAAAGDRPPGRDCPIPLVDYWELPAYLRWTPGVTWLVLLLPIYGAAHFVRRRRQANAV